MIFIDTDIFVIDKLFPNDDRYELNKAFLNEAKEKNTSIFNLFDEAKDEEIVRKALFMSRTKEKP